MLITVDNEEVFNVVMASPDMLSLILSSLPAEALMGALGDAGLAKWMEDGCNTLEVDDLPRSLETYVASYNRKQKVTSIKAVREITCVGLKEAKEYIEGEIALPLTMCELAKLRKLEATGNIKIRVAEFAKKAEEVGE